MDALMMHVLPAGKAARRQALSVYWQKHQFAHIPCMGS
jgi:hypothetical protein